jgi:hypothetical protein
VKFDYVNEKCVEFINLGYVSSFMLVHYLDMFVCH